MLRSRSLSPGPGNDSKPGEKLDSVFSEDEGYPYQETAENRVMT
jgi:hypothetical protein